MNENTNRSIETYLNNVTEQIRFKKARSMVSKELRNHILEEVEFLRQAGLDEDESVKQAILEMGDPIAVGVSFDKIHKPKISWSTFLTVGVISVLSILLQVTLEQKGMMFATAGHHILYTIVGMILMFGIYYIDYSVWGKYADVIGMLFLGAMIVTFPFRTTINGSSSFIIICSVSFSVPLVMYLFVPIFGAILFQYRGEGYKALWKLVLWMGTAVMLVLNASVIHAMILGFSLLALFFISVWKEWYSVNKKCMFALTGGMMLLSPFFLVHMLSDYYWIRIQAFFQNNPDYVYITNKAISILESAKWFGQSEQGLSGSLPGYNNELILVSLVACFGIVVGCLGVIPITSVVLPFFSRSGSGSIVSYVLMGIFLSIYRYQNLPAGTIPKSRLKISIRWEKEA